LTAGLFSQVSEARPHTLGRLRVLFAGGDILPPAAVQRVLSAGGRVVNGYGPTENTCFTCCFDMRDPSAVDAGVLIGRPVAGTYVYILDGAGRPAPIGIPGELVAGGDGVSPGYLGAAGDLSRFMPDPLDPARGTVYRTGDLVRWRASGDIEFLGRRDRQVKIRGFRIELGEIEACLGGDPEVGQCVVLVRGEDAGEKSLAAFLVLRSGPGAIDDVKRRLASQLPAYMIPSTITCLDALPLGENGKVDAASLLRRSPAPAVASEGADPEGELQTIVAAAFAKVLGLSSVPVDRDFFELGGHSLHATRVVTRLRETLSVRLPLQAIFEFPTVAGLAQALETLLLDELDATREAAE
jgi:acyl-coenzyme A synthetase/AMP-(fatty) acid ligase/acyl carrier protein